MKKIKLHTKTFKGHYVGGAKKGRKVTREKLSLLARSGDIDNWEGILPKSKKVDPWNRLMTNLLGRWFFQQVGRKWDAVYSDFLRVFGKNFQTIYAIESVINNNVAINVDRGQDFFVDNEGLLQTTQCCAEKEMRSRQLGKKRSCKKTQYTSYLPRPDIEDLDYDEVIQLVIYEGVNVA